MVDVKVTKLDDGRIVVQKSIPLEFCSLFGQTIGPILERYGIFMRNPLDITGWKFLLQYHGQSGEPFSDGRPKKRFGEHEFDTMTVECGDALVGVGLIPQAGERELDLLRLDLAGLMNAIGATPPGCPGVMVGKINWLEVRASMAPTPTAT